MTIRRYSISFTTCSIRKLETLKIAAIYFESRDWNAIRQTVLDRNILQQRTQRSMKRLYQELSSRLRLLNISEMDLLGSGTEQEQKLLLWLATCRRYDFIYDFAVEVLREQMLNFHMKIEPEDFDGFWASKAIVHDELDTVARSTRIKARQVVFKMLREVGLINEQNEIQLVTYTNRFIGTISERDLFIFPFDESMIRFSKA